MCNCAAPNGANYDSYNNAVAQCGAYPSGASGFASCVANVLGYVSRVHVFSTFVLLTTFFFQTQHIKISRGSVKLPLLDSLKSL